MASNLMGEYHFTNSCLVSTADPSLTLVIGVRKKPTPEKPKYYLLQRFQSGGHKYLSSLYIGQESPENGLKTYSLDYDGIRYQMDVSASGAKISGLKSAKAAASPSAAQNLQEFLSNF